MEPSIVEEIRAVIRASRAPGHAAQKAVLGPVSAWIVRAAAQAGLEIDGYRHIIDGSAVRHIVNRHGSAEVEHSRGQLPIREVDIEALPALVSDPDCILLGSRGKGTKDQIGYLKKLDDGTTLYLEEVRRGRRELAALSMRKYPATKDFDDIAATLPSNARGDGGNIVIVHPADSDALP